MADEPFFARAAKSIAHEPVLHLSLDDGVQPPYAQYGLSTLSSEAGARFGTSGSVLDVLLPRLSHSVPYVNACASMLGIVTMMQSSREHAGALECLAVSAYSSCVQCIRRELIIQPDGSVPLILSCLFLVVVELLLAQPRKAFVHLRAAHEMLARLNESPCKRTTLSTGNDLEMLFRTLDVQISSFKWDYVRNHNHSALSTASLMYSDLHTARLALLQLLHAGSVFVADVFTLKYLPTLQSRNLLVEQGRHIAALSIWLEQFSIKIMPGFDTKIYTKDAEQEHALALRMTCMSWLIRLSHILDADETSYDVHAPRFRQMVLDAEQIIMIREARRAIKEESPVHAECVLGVGVIEPLLLVATKFRDVPWRWRAITCLKKAGLELPFNGPREAAIAQYIADYEATNSLSKLHSSECKLDSNDFTENRSREWRSMVPNRCRINGHRIAEDGFLDGNSAVVTFYRCIDMQAMYSCPSCQGDWNTPNNQSCH